GVRRLLGERDLPLEDADERRPVALARVDPRQRLEGLRVARQDLAQLLPGLAGPRDVLQRLLAQARQRALVVRLRRQVARDALDLEVQDARELGVLAERRIEARERVEGARVVGIEV